MATGGEIRIALRASADDLSTRLATEFGLARGDHRLYSTTTGGLMTRLARSPWPGLQLDLWLDTATGGNEPRYWYGFYAQSRKKLIEFVTSLPKSFQPQGQPLGEADWKRIGGADSGQFVYRAPNKKVQSEYFFEFYGTEGAFFGRYDWGGHGNSTSDLWTDVAFSFFREAIKGWGAPNEEEYEALEGKKLFRFLAHRSRDRRLRELKVAETLQKTGALKCEVPNCGFEFGKTYGDLGRDFAEVHHKRPLASPETAQANTTKDVVIVCSNCHRMIHRSMIRGGRSWPPSFAIA